MNRLLAGLLLVLGLAGCSRELVEQPTTAEQMPVSLDLPELDSGPAEYQHAVDPATGVQYWRLRKTGGSRFAIVDYLQAHSDYVFRERSTRAWIGTFLKDDVDITWQDSGYVRSGGTLTNWESFDLGKNVRCLGFMRELKRHAESGGQPNSTQSAIVAIYCRPGVAPLGAQEAEEVAAAIRLKA